jgi:hypothetical protein
MNIALNVAPKNRRVLVPVLIEFCLNGSYGSLLDFQWSWKIRKTFGKVDGVAALSEQGKLLDG